jgi:hypothetical protein
VTNNAKQYNLLLALHPNITQKKLLRKTNTLAYSANPSVTKKKKFDEFHHQEKNKNLLSREFNLVAAESKLRQELMDKLLEVASLRAEVESLKQSNQVGPDHKSEDDKSKVRLQEKYLFLLNKEKSSLATLEKLTRFQCYITFFFFVHWQCLA